MVGASKSQRNRWMMMAKRVRCNDSVGYCFDDLDREGEIRFGLRGRHEK